MSQRIAEPEQLIGRISHASQKDLSDLLLIMAKNVEAAYLSAGAIPGKDYTMRDLFTMGLPFALKVWEDSNGDIGYTTDNF